jgi:hypothetical protein
MLLQLARQHGRELGGRVEDHRRTVAAARKARSLAASRPGRRAPARLPGRTRWALGREVGKARNGAMNRSVTHTLNVGLRLSW